MCGKIHSIHNIQRKEIQFPSWKTYILTFSAEVCHTIWDYWILLRKLAKTCSAILAISCRTRLDRQLHPVTFASRFLTPTEKGWAQIENECLALTWTCKKFSHFFVGLPKFELLTDHKPLVPLINTKELDQTPIRVHRLLMRLMRFNCVCSHVPGMALVVSDALNRSKVSIQPQTGPRRTWPTQSRSTQSM